MTGLLTLFDHSKIFVPLLFKLKIKEENYGEKQRVKTTVVSLDVFHWPLDFKSFILIL